MTSAPATNTDGAWLCSLLQLGDSFYPTGAYAHSFGLEGLAQEGVIRDRETLRAYLFSSVLPTLRQVELPLAAHAWRALAAPNWDQVGELLVLSSALKTASEARAASENIGRQRVELCARLRDHPLAHEFLKQAAQRAWPFSASIAAALEGRVTGAPLSAVLASVYYGSVGALLAAAMKLLRLGQNGAQALLTESLAAAPAIIAEAGRLPIEEIGWLNPWLDIASARHATADARMFIS